MLEAELTVGVSTKRDLSGKEDLSEATSDMLMVTLMNISELGGLTCARWVNQNLFAT